MIRPLTALLLLGAAGTGLNLYSVKQGTTLLERELRDIRRQTEAARDRTQVLRAEWALLNEPDRLRQVVQRHLPLDAMAPGQFVREADLARRLPAPVVFAGTPSLFAPAPGGEPPRRENVLVARAAEPQVVLAAVAPPAPMPNVASPVAPTTVAALLPAPRAAAPRPQAPPPPVLPAGGLQPTAASGLAPPSPVGIATPATTAPITTMQGVIATPLPPIAGTTQAPPTAYRPPPRPAAPPSMPYAATPAARPPAQLVRTPSPPAAVLPPSVAGTPGQNIRPLLPPPVPYGAAGAGLISSARASTLTAQAGR